MKAILVGMGGRAQSWIGVCDRVRKSGTDVDLVGFVEPVDDQRTKVAEKFSIGKDRLFSSLTVAVAGTEADFVIDVTPPAVHEAVALEAFDAGLHVIGEKPLSDDFAAAKRIVDASESAGKTHMITQNYRFGNVPRTTRRLLAEDRIGTPEQVVVGFQKTWAHNPGSHYTTMAHPLLTDMGIHHFDLMRYVLACEPVSASCTIWNPSWGWHAGEASHVLYVEFEGGLHVIHHAFGSSVGRQSPWNGDWHIDGPEGSISWEDDHLFVTRNHPPDQKAREEIPVDELPHLGQDACLVEFLAAITEGREPECSGRDNLKSLALTFAAVQSAVEKRPVQISELL